MLSTGLSDHIRELAGEGNDPLAVAFSGGGDSTALLALVLEAFRDQEREIHAFIVDHDLREGSTAEANLAAKRARAIGAKVDILKWDHDNPTTGIQEKARNARYALLGEACRRYGISKLFLGHSRDDQAETVFMRKNKQSGWRGLAGMQMQVIAPLWPALYDIKVLRPLLGESRQELRTFNSDHSLKYIDDPANVHLGFERIRARYDLLEKPEVTEQMIDLSRESQFDLKKENRRLKKLIAIHVEITAWGGAYIRSIDQIDGVSNLAGILRFILPCVSGGSGFPPSGKLKNLVWRLHAPKFKGATFAGARLIGTERGILIVRDPGMILGRNQKPALETQELTPGQVKIWDGRFLIETNESGLTVAAVGTAFDQLDKKTKQSLKQLPLAARKTLPCIIDGHEIVTVPFLDNVPDIEAKTNVKSLISTRLSGFLDAGQMA